MSRTPFAVALLWAGSVAGGEAPMPGLRIEPTTYASILFVRNTAPVPLTAFLVELVNYPGSFYQLWEDDASEPIAPGVEKRIQIRDMTVGAVPDYVKVRAALYADGTTSGLPEKVTQLVERRQFVLQTTRELIVRLEKAKSAGTSKESMAADLKQSSGTLHSLNKRTQNAQPSINEAGAKALFDGTAAQLGTSSVEDVLAGLRKTVDALAAEKTTP